MSFDYHKSFTPGQNIPVYSSDNISFNIHPQCLPLLYLLMAAYTLHEPLFYQDRQRNLFQHSYVFLAYYIAVFCIFCSLSFFFFILVGIVVYGIPDKVLPMYNHFPVSSGNTLTVTPPLYTYLFFAASQWLYINSRTLVPCSTPHGGPGLLVILTDYPARVHFRYNW